MAIVDLMGVVVLDVVIERKRGRKKSVEGREGREEWRGREAGRAEERRVMWKEKRGGEGGRD